MFSQSVLGLFNNALNLLIELLEDVLYTLHLFCCPAFDESRISFLGRNLNILLGLSLDF